MMTKKAKCHLLQRIDDLVGTDPKVLRAVGEYLIERATAISIISKIPDAVFFDLIHSDKE